MPMREELSAPGMRAAWQKRPTEPMWRQLAEIRRSPDLVVIIVLTAIGLSLSFCVELLPPSFLNIIG
jgi:hypothetical protein